MSHNVSLKNVRIRDIDAVRQACEELSAELRTSISLVKDGEIRSYSSYRPEYARYAPVEKADYVIRLGDHKYDIGLVKQSDGTYVPRYESEAMRDFGQTIGVEQGAQTAEGQSCSLSGGGAAIGRLLQRVNVIVAEKEAAANGYVAERQYDDKTKVMNLVVTGM